ncbi:MAG TPA: hypothetical protein VN736_13770 [Candidatus Limnocylindrales bacterium]|nr:hypothetical protein [Candidatus Limnocylindrales bacterium]
MPAEDNSVKPSPIENDVPVAMRKVYRRLQRWGRERKGREPIPPALWMAAGALARQHGVNQVSRVLHLEFNQLKRVAEGSERSGRKRTEPAFVELVAPQTSAGPECMLEVESARGRLRIDLKGMTVAELAGISRALWEMIA